MATKAHDGLPATKAGERYYRFKEKTIDEAMDVLCRLDEALGSTVKRNNPITNFVIAYEDARGVYLDDDLERCEACQGVGALEALWLYPGEVTIEGVKRLLDRGISAAQKRASPGDKSDQLHLQGLRELKQYTDSIAIHMKLNS